MSDDEPGYVGEQHARRRGREFRRGITRDGEVGPWFEIARDGILVLCDNTQAHHGGQRVRVGVLSIEEIERVKAKFRRIGRKVMPQRFATSPEGASRFGNRFLCTECPNNLRLTEEKARVLHAQLRDEGESQVTLSELQRRLRP